MARRRVAITGLGPRHAGRQRRRHDLGRAARTAGAAARRSACSTPADFPVHIAAEVKNFDDDVLGDRKLLKFTTRSHRFALAAADQALSDAGIRPTAATGDALGLRRRRRHDDLGVRRSRRHPRALGRRRRAARRSAAHRPGGQRPDGVLPQPGDRRDFAPHPPLRHPRLRHLGAHGLRLRRAGARHGAEAHPPRRGRLRARRRLRFDDQPDRHVRLLPAVGAFARQRHAAAGEPPVRRDAQRLPARRRRRVPGARGVGRGARARRADLRRARRRRQFAVLLPDHRFAARRRRADPVDARGAEGRGRGAGRRRLPQRPRHLDRDERPQRERGDARGVRRRRERSSTSARPRARWGT